MTPGSRSEQPRHSSGSAGPQSATYQSATSVMSQAPTLEDQLQMEADQLHGGADQSQQFAGAVGPYLPSGYYAGQDDLDDDRDFRECPMPIPTYYAQ